jgi:uncharacterized membrane protein YfcA
MAILVSLLSVPSAMVVHGAVQAASNGARWLFLRQHMQWQIVPPYIFGAAIVVSAFSLLAFVPDPAIVLIVVGSLPWLARVTPRLRGLDISRPMTALACGIVVTTAQLFAGASGPLLDVFYLNSSLDRYQIIASKAFTQTIGHILKLTYYSTIFGVVSVNSEISLWIIVTAIGMAIFGARIGTRLLRHINDDQFRRLSGWIILALGAVCIVNGIVNLR